MTSIEELTQRGIVQLLQLQANPDWIWFHVPNGEYRSKRTGARLKAMGVRAGVADLCLISPGSRAHFIEVKAPKGRMSPEQRAFRDACERAGAGFAIVRSIDEAGDVMQSWGVFERPVALLEAAE